MSARPSLPTADTPSSASQGDSVASLLARGLQRHGIQTVFGQSIPSGLHLACEALGMRQIGYRTENAGGYMADGHARIAGQAAVVTAQNGPAATLLVAPLAEALKASIPIVALVQDVQRNHTDRNAFQEYDHLGLFAACTKWVRRVTDASRIEDYLDQAFANACGGRPGPVALLLPMDLLAETAPPALRKASLSQFPLDRTVAAPAALAEAAELLRHARAPIVIAGGGVHVSGASAALAALQHDAHLPVATTTMGKGSVDERAALSVGVIGSFMGPNAMARHQRSLVSEADVVLLVGNRTNQNGTDSWTLYPRAARYIHLDVDSAEVGRNYEALRLVGDARETLQALRLALLAGDLSARAAARPSLEQRIGQGRAMYLQESLPVRTSAARPIRPERIMHELDALLGDEAIVVADASYASTWIANYLTSTRPGMRFLTPRGLAGLGWGLPMAMGAKIARPAAPVFCVVGDGGFGHVWSELETAARSGIALTLVVINNGILGFQKHAEQLKYRTHTTAVDFAPVDHAAIARACGCIGVRIEDPAQLAPALRDAAGASTTTVLDVVCDPEAFPPLTFFSPPAEAGRIPVHL